MNQFKPIFLGTIGKTDPMASLKRAVDSQKVYLVLSSSSGVLLLIPRRSVSVLVANIMCVAPPSPNPFCFPRGTPDLYN